MVPEYTINGSFGEVRDQDGNWLANCQRVEGKIAIDKETLKLSGTRKTAHKAKGVEGTGTLSMLKVTSDFLQKIGEFQRNDRSVHFVGQLVVTLDDPESLGAEKILLKGVKFWEIGFGWEVDQIVKDEIPFTFFDHELLNPIAGDMLKAK